MTGQEWLEFIRAESKKSWANNAGILWKELSDADKLQILNLRENNIIDFDAVQGDYVFFSERSGKNEKGKFTAD